MLALLVSFAPVSVDHRPVIDSKPYFINSVGMRFMRVPPNGIPFSASPIRYSDIYDDRLAASLVNREFYISATLVTQEQFLRVTGRNPSHPSKPDFPVQCVTWEDAIAFCNALSARTTEVPAANECRVEICVAHWRIIDVEP